jgi:hypothetical protein
VRNQTEQSKRLSLDERGAAVIMAFILSFMAGTLAVIAAKYIVSSSRESKQYARVYAEADSAARAGVMDTLSWFRRQGTVVDSSSGVYSHPDEAFSPLQNPTPPALPDTDNESLGLVRSYELETSTGTGPRLMAAYVVRRQREFRVLPTHTPDPFWSPGTETPTPTPSPAMYVENAVHDVTSMRMSGVSLLGGTPVPLYHTGMGLVWSIASTGYVFRDMDGNGRLDLPSESVSGATTVVRNLPDPVTILSGGVTHVTPVPAGTPVDRILAVAKAFTEIRRVTLNAPSAAILCNRGDRIRVSGRARVMGNSPYFGAAFPSGTGSPSIASPGKLNSTTTMSSPVSVSAIWGNLSTAELRSMADAAVTSVPQLPYLDKDSNGTPDTLPDMRFYFIDGPATFTSTHLFRGSGILFVNGNLTVSNVTDMVRNHGYDGIVYVTGNAVVNAMTNFSGMLMVQGGVTVQGTGTEWADILYSDGARTDVINQMLQYRENRSASRTVFVPFQ